MKINAMILAAGLGSRLAPITRHVPKPVLPVGRQPLLHLVIDKLKKAGADKIAINTHYLPEQVAACVKASSAVNDITIFHEETLLDTAGPLVNAREMLCDCDCFLLHNGDVFTDFDIAPMLKKHQESGAIMTMAVLKGPENRLHIKNDTIVDIKDLAGVPYSPESRKYTYGCAAVLSPEIFGFLPENPVPCHFYQVWEKALKAGKKIVPYYIPEGTFWSDIGTAEQYFAACKYAAGPTGLAAAADAVIATEAKLKGFNIIASGATVPADAELTNCIVLANAVVPPGRRINQVIGRDFICHRDEKELTALKLFADSPSGTEFSSLEEQGSSRRFYRVKTADSPDRILMLSDNTDKDFSHFIKLGNFFSRNGMFTPEIYAADNEEYSVLMEDLGDNVLFRHLQGEDEEHIFRHYCSVLKTLVSFQEKGRAAIAEEDMEYRLFNRKILLWESEYFMENFLQKLCGLDIPLALRQETRSIALAAETLPVAVMHRDFQSQNIVLQQDKVRFVDFQGSRLGPYTYDAASLIKDPYMDLSKELREQLYEVFYRELQAAGFNIPYTDFRRDCLLGALQRNMQALGAYGFLSLEKGKVHYLDYAPPCLKLLQEGIEEFSLISPFSVSNLQNICRTAGNVLAEKIKIYKKVLV